MEVANKYRSEDVGILSDTHIGHANIIKYCDRPFTSIGEMDDRLIAAILENDRQGKILLHGGDIMFRGRVKLPTLKNAKYNIAVAGNHDENLADYTPWFGTIVGTQKSWRYNQFPLMIDEALYVMSHNPQLKLPANARNLHGHVHNGPYSKVEYFLTKGRDKDIHFIFDNDDYINCCVELLDYTPRSIQYLEEQVNVPTIPVEYRHLLGV